MLTDVGHIRATVHQLQRGVPDLPGVVLQERLGHFSDLVQRAAGPRLHQQGQVW